jgi:Protein of unknown function (DUF2635)
MLVKPAPGRTVRDPRSMALLPEEGRTVPDNDPFWLRRVRDGDVTKEAAPAAPGAPPPSAKPAPLPAPGPAQHERPHKEA